MRRFNLYLPTELFNALKIHSQKNSESMTKCIVTLLEDALINSILEEIKQQKEKE